MKKQVYVGIDVSKETLDVALGDKPFVVNNDPEGIAILSKKLRRSKPAIIAIEAKLLIRLKKQPREACIARSMLSIVKVLESILYAEDLCAAQEFYSRILGLEVINADTNRHLFFRCEGSVLILFKASKTQIPDAGVPPHGTDGAGHLAFSAAHEEIETWRQRLTDSKVSIIEEIHWPNGAHSIYFHDPAGNVLEFATPDLYGKG